MPPSSAAPSRLHALTVLRLALATYTLNARRIAAATVVLLVPLNMIANATTTEVDSATDPLDLSVVTRVMLALLGGLGAALSTVCFAGLLDQVVGERLHGRSRRGFGAVPRELPVCRLLLASFLLAGVLVVNGPMSATAGAVTGLVEVVLADVLLTREQAMQPDAQPAPPAVP